MNVSCVSLCVIEGGVFAILLGVLCCVEDGLLLDSEP